MNQITKKSLSAFVIIGLVITVGFFLTENILLTQEDNSRVVNISGRQRMLSQKISKSALALSREITQESIDELSSALELWEESQNALRYGDEEFGIKPNYSKGIFEMYEAVNSSHKLITNAAKNIINKLEETNTANFQEDLNIILENEDIFLVQMNEIVFAHDLEASNQLKRTRIIEYILNAFILVLMMALWVFLVKPTLKKSEEIKKAKDEFVSLASHQLRTPLTAISWNSEMLLKEELGKINMEQKEMLNALNESAQKMTRLVNKLLDISKIEADVYPIKEEETNIEVLVKKVVNEIKIKTDSRKQKLSLNIQKNIPKIKADKSLLQIILQNLLTNAHHYTPEKGEIGLSINKIGGKLQIEVSDTGIGIPKHQQNKIFSKLFRADNAQKQDTEGTGLGLYMTKTVLEKMGGEISFTSLENKGTTFTVRLPFRG